MIANFCTVLGKTHLLKINTASELFRRDHRIIRPRSTELPYSLSFTRPRGQRLHNICPFFTPDVTVQEGEKGWHLSSLMNPCPLPPISPLDSFRFPPPPFLRIPLSWRGSYSSPISVYSTHISKVMRCHSFSCYSMRSPRFESLISDYNSITHLSLNFSRKLAPSHSWTINQTLGLNHFLPLLSSHSFRSRRKLFFPFSPSLRYLNDVFVKSEDQRREKKCWSALFWAVCALFASSISSKGRGDGVSTGIVKVERGGAW